MGHRALRTVGFPFAVAPYALKSYAVAVCRRPSAGIPVFLLLIQRQPPLINPTHPLLRNPQMK